MSPSPPPFFCACSSADNKLDPEHLISKGVTAAGVNSIREPIQDFRLSTSIKTRRMPAELYIYGGAFGLPSIDPQCLALISYMSIVSHQEFSIIECNDAGFSPTGQYNGQRGHFDPHSMRS